MYYCRIGMMNAWTDVEEKVYTRDLFLEGLGVNFPDIETLVSHVMFRDFKVKVPSDSAGVLRKNKGIACVYYVYEHN